jgi:hypothetical protein
MTKKTKRKLPSEEKYDKNHPTVSARIPREKRDKLNAVLRSLGVSLANLLVSFADAYEIKVKPLDEARQEASEKAEKRFMVTYECNVCGKSIQITNPNVKKAAGSYMTEHGWGHSGCHSRPQQSK